MTIYLVVAAADGGEIIYSAWTTEVAAEAAIPHHRETMKAKYGQWFRQEYYVTSIELDKLEPVMT